MSKLPHGQEVIDLLSSSDEEDGSNAPSDSKRRRRFSPPPPAHVATNAAGAGRTSAVGGQMPLSSQPAPLVFISSEDGGDYCTVTEGLMTRLKQQRRFLQTAVTCAGPLLPGSESTLRHIQQNDAWSCGFRNLQMMLSAVVPLLFKDHSYYEQQPFVRDAGYVTIPSLKELSIDGAIRFFFFCLLRSVTYAASSNSGSNCTTTTRQRYEVIPVIPRAEILGYDNARR